jgi:alkylated DNA repair dioxygenase AlkB
LNAAVAMEIPSRDFSYVPHALGDADDLFGALMADVPWQQESITLFGVGRPMPRLTCWMGDAAYVYSGLRNEPQDWSPAVAGIKDRVEELAGARFNGVLLNLYRDGRDSMGWHADDEPSLGPAPMIASMSLGGQRRMRFKPKPHHGGAPFEVTLAPGSVLIMRGRSQADWLHAIPKTAKPVAPRINLTFRHVE